MSKIIIQRNNLFSQFYTKITGEVKNIKLFVKNLKDFV